MTAAISVRDRVLVLVGEIVALLENDLGEFQPMGDRVLVVPNEEPFERRVGLVYVVEEAAAQQKPWTGIVLRMGPGTLQDGRRIPPAEGVRVGDVVLMGRNVGEPMRKGDVDMRLVRGADILAVFADAVA